jgi:predicted aldo/keto reductase-like oxidoreductase
MNHKPCPNGTGLSRRDFLCQSSVAAAALAVGASQAAGAAPTAKILNYNENMEYRRCGKTGLMISCVALGGHWKRLDTVVPGLPKGEGYASADFDKVNNPAFAKNRYDIVTRCMELGFNYVDACAGPEIMAYSKAIKGRRDKMYLGYSWYEKEARFEQWRTAKKLLQGLDEGMKQAGLDYIDVWRISALTEGSRHSTAEVEEMVAALAAAKKQGKARFTGLSSHDRPWLQMMVEKYPEQLEVILTPYTANSKVLPEDSLFDAVKKQDVGVFGIKPFASNSLFKGDSALNSPDAEEDDRRARLAIRYILSNPGITAPMPGLINLHQVENVAKAVRERRELDQKETAELQKANAETWAKLPPDYQWLKQWEYV